MLLYRLRDPPFLQKDVASASDPLIPEYQESLWLQGLFRDILTCACSRDFGLVFRGAWCAQRQPAAKLVPWTLVGNAKISRSKS